MAYAMPMDLKYIHSWNNDLYSIPKKKELSESELIGLRTLKSMGIEEARLKLEEYFLGKYFN